MICLLLLHTEVEGNVGLSLGEGIGYAASPPPPLKLLGASLFLCLCYIPCEQYILGKRGGGVGVGRVTKGAIYDVR